MSSNEGLIGFQEQASTNTLYNKDRQQPQGGDYGNRHNVGTSPFREISDLKPEEVTTEKIGANADPKPDNDYE